MKSRIITLSIASIGICFAAAAHAETLELASPNGSNKVTFAKDGKDLTYSVSYKGQPVILPSQAGLDLDNRVWEMALGKRDLQQPECWMDMLVVDSVTYGAPVRNVWHPLYGERSEVVDAYNPATLHMSRHDKSKYRLDVEVRAYDQGIAFRYFFPEHPDAIFHKVTDDLTSYAFPKGTQAWSEQWAQARFDVGVVDSITHPVERALTLRLPNQGPWVALLDADVDDWCLTKYVADTAKESTLKSVMYSPVDIVTYCATPWKVIMTADKPGDLIENNDIVLNLNPECEIADPAFVKPGMIMRTPRIDTELGLRTIDFCAEHNIPYMLYDWKWYEPCTSHDGDATKIVDHLDLHKVIAYGKEKGVGVWLYVNQHALMKQMDELFPLLKEWGVVGVKSGFVQYASHRWATWLHDMVRKAAENGLMMNIHDEYRPSGFSRTYPNLLTQEGICGNEEWPDATHNVTLPFTRMINGAADYTICYFDKRLKSATHAHQLAASLVFYSPLLTVFWYDDPSRYNGEKEISWFENLKTVFDDTKVLSGYPGESIVMARRSGDTWYAAAMTGNEASTQSIPLDFLEPGVKYRAVIYADDPKVDTATHVAITEKKVSSKDTLKFSLQPQGGVAVRFEKI